MGDVLERSSLKLVEMTHENLESYISDEFVRTYTNVSTHPDVSVGSYAG
jgi:hypothetical protein